ncbi:MULTISPECIES: bifunctional 2-polyprenyl-6-hydroxyphenol methylase/3-demethylubiquinol 3-O-methyltransferase UbiG [unclassified Streptomyces]|uniref:class I SAM-dependent methyltransferase n=1 Tax=unclassified Streptomyces TaxID=2593676 RepID=UPI00088C0701|nr:MULTISPECIES: class I SAM-dependent methyltransferase [unclassified Streptomyces]PBC84671.1 methyltransferase family protein [Streptomyces sp. 2321.6]SDR28276.1 Methyltransferase domain-containing protein [Streptomyces sp. KS_16]SED40019.1 Methyltransferase domain-containing protein [Streptomyces sp. 2133.1]SNC70693.1 Methyltransferase domain-containing protein [Streptomyces sp. 2114.4]
MLAQASPWHLHALQRTSAELAEALAVPARMEWGTRLGQGPDANLLGPDLRGRHVLELGCGPGHNVAHVAVHRGATVTGVDLVGLQIRRARSHYGRLAGARFVAGHALHYLQATDETYDAIYSVFGAIGLVAPELLLPAIVRKLAPRGTLAFSVPHPRRSGRHPSADDRPCQDFVTLPDLTRLPIARWEFDSQRWSRHLTHAGLEITTSHELGVVRPGCRPTTLLITARRT